MTLLEGLADGLAELNIAMSEDAQAKQINYLVLIEKWNKVHNLTAIRDPEQMLAHHLLDSLAVLAPFGRGENRARCRQWRGFTGYSISDRQFRFNGDVG